MKDSVSPKVYWLKMTLDILQIKQSEIARELKLSPGQISKLINCEQKNQKFDEWVSKQITKRGLLVTRNND